MTDKLNHGQLPLFTVIFKDKSHFVGGMDQYETNWMNIPINKPIQRIFYRLPSNDYLCLENYDKYFRMSEACKDLNGKKKGEVRLQYEYIMCLKNDTVRSYRITLHNYKNDKFKPCDITTRIFNINDDKISKLNVDIWRG